MERKLTVMLSAGVKDYSRLMGEDEKILHTLTAYRKDVVDGSDAIGIEVEKRVWRIIICRRFHGIVDAVGS